ncbi:hypothetical protein BV25DRAFT_1835361 [Artomyces pyxidatus]|uniref:Uncharacterized protein n=1 Tax=Artomyces pyxidatus TaxID=48021 RepID=A0ACB8TF17_9AGAM|nr:hypothetical protein BV25DRAFT_1835361 [Artomyces pyxidatus]
MVSLVCSWVLALATLSCANAYTPASPTNDTSGASANTPSTGPPSTLYLQWYKQGSFSTTISYERVKSQGTGVSKGAFVHFSEEVEGNTTTTTPWIAFIQCDYNVTQASGVEDIFTLASQRGAVGALLFSQWSEACVVNPAFHADTNKQLMDIFATRTLSSSKRVAYSAYPSSIFLTLWFAHRIIQAQFANVNESVYGSYNATQLTASQAEIENSLKSGYPTAFGYLMVILDALNATASPSVSTQLPGPTPTANSPSAGSGSSKKSAGQQLSPRIRILCAICGVLGVLVTAYT